ncbi:MAG TPA: dihydropyrimidinase [Pirellulales bacterium]|jgi:dihydropyrimidinase|nr:dihydropyrimidinase [Pirellulales bacterium]
MPLLVKNADIVTVSERYTADIWCADETITQIGPNLPAPAGAEVIDAHGKQVFPGFIDPHTHIYLPFMGTFSKDDYDSASRAALVGGTTTLFDMCIPVKEQDPRDAFELWNSQARGKASCDWSYHMAVTRWDATVERQLREIVAEGVPSFKVFLAYKGALDVDDAALFQTLQLARELGVVVTVHCENAEAIARAQARLIAEGKTGPEYHEPSRRPRVEAEGVHHLCTFAELTGARVYIVHLSCDEALRVALEARHRGVDVAIETLIQYLVLDKTWAERPNFEGAKYVMSPPLRDRANQAVLWNALRTGEIQTVATDHAPFDFATQKPMGRDDFSKIPNGIPALEERVNLLYTHGVHGGRIDLHRFVDLASTRAARLFGLFPRKGTIQPGSDADLVIYDPEYHGTITHRRQQSAVDYNAFEGFEIHGRPSIVTLRGQVMVRDGKFVGPAGKGKFLQRPAEAL